jgi:hypothetical protein
MMSSALLRGVNDSDGVHFTRAVRQAVLAEGDSSSTNRPQPEGKTETSPATTAYLGG